MVGNVMNRTIVVGAGPAGLTLALQLARSGQAVTLVEANPDLSRQFRGDALMPSGLEALARMGLWPLLERLPQRPLEGWSVWLERRRLFSVEEPRTTVSGTLAWAVETLLRGGRTAAQIVAEFTAAAGSPQALEVAGSTTLTLRELGAQYPQDPGVLIGALLNRVELHRGEALYLPAGNVHAYLEGLGIQVADASGDIVAG